MTTKDKLKHRLDVLQNVISPYMTEISELQEKLARIEHNEFRLDVHLTIESLQTKFPHLGKFYFDEKYDSWDDVTHYYITYQGDDSIYGQRYLKVMRDEVHRLSKKYPDKIIFVDREDFDVYMNRITGGSYVELFQI